MMDSLGMAGGNLAAGGNAVPRRLINEAEWIARLIQPSLAPNRAASGKRVGAMAGERQGCLARPRKVFLRVTSSLTGKLSDSCSLPFWDDPAFLGSV